jgi:hypothetical protein
MTQVSLPTTLIILKITFLFIDVTMPTILFDILGLNEDNNRRSDESAGNPLVNIELTRENRAFMNLRMDQVTDSFDNVTGEMIRTHKYYKVEKCTEEYFTQDDKTKKRA